MAKITDIGARTQLAALPWRRRGDRVELLMITSRLSRHWLIPKGWPMQGKTDAQAAAREAYEEAGVKGIISHRPVGNYRYDKLLPDGRAVPCSVEVYALQVDKELTKWPETDCRERLWMALGDAAAVAFEPGLAAFLRGLEPGSLLESAGKVHRQKARV